MKKTFMEYKGFSAQIMEARRLIGDHVFDLPEGVALQVYYADEFLHPPENWMKGQGVFVVPVNPDKGLWFNWRMNDELNCAILPTVKGCNPITGLKTSGFFMEQYNDKCPEHGCDFIADRFCEKCGYKWPQRNYISMAPLWWDGFRADDGTVRQFFFTPDELRDIASHKIGAENTVPAFGFTFFTPKETRSHPKYGSGRGMQGSIFTLTGGLSADESWVSNPQIYHSTHDFKHYGEKITCSSSLDCSMKEVSFSASNSADEQTSGGLVSSGTGTKKMSKFPHIMKKSSVIQPNSMKVMRSAEKKEIRTLKIKPDIYMNTMNDVGSAPKKEVKKVSIGAGAKIRQALNHDSYPLDSWKEKPDAVMTIYFVFQEEFEEIKAKGIRDISSAKEGMLQGLPVG